MYYLYRLSPSCPLYSASKPIAGSKKHCKFIYQTIQIVLIEQERDSKKREAAHLAPLDPENNNANLVLKQKLLLKESL
jgi:hypothetical protein